MKSKPLSDDYAWLREDLLQYENDWSEQCPSRWIGIVSELLATIDSLREELDDSPDCSVEFFTKQGQQITDLIEVNQKLREELKNWKRWHSMIKNALHVQLEHTEKLEKENAKLKANLEEPSKEQD